MKYWQLLPSISLQKVRQADFHNIFGPSLVGIIDYKFMQNFAITIHCLKVLAIGNIYKATKWEKNKSRTSDCIISTNTGC